MIQYNVQRLIVAIAVTAFLALPVSLHPQSATSPTPKQSTSPTAQKKTTPTKKPPVPPLQLEPKALEILKAASSRLASAHTLSFTAVETFESLSRQGAPLVYANRSDVALARPDKLRVILAGDGPVSEFYDDGKMMMAYAPVENLVAVADAPPTIDATLEKIYHSAGIYFPFTDLIVADPYGDLAPGLKHAYYVGQSKVVGGTTTDIVAYMGDGVFVQMWVGTEDHLPREMHAIFLDDPDLLRHNLSLSDWQIDTPISADAFTSANAAGARKMQFVNPSPELSPGARPPANNAPPKKTKPSANPQKSN